MTKIPNILLLSRFGQNAYVKHRPSITWNKKKFGVFVFLVYYPNDIIDRAIK